MSNNKDDRAKMEQIVGECFVKAANIILSSRISQTTRPNPRATSAKRSWFNLEVEEVEGAQEDIQQWRRHTTQPLILQIYQGDATGIDRAQQDTADINHKGKCTILETWCIQWEQDKKVSKHQSSRLEPAAIYKRLVIMLRSLFTYVRILPAYKLYKMCKRKGGSEPQMQYAIGKSLDQMAGATSQKKSQAFQFAPIETPYGSLKINIRHLPASAVNAAEPANPVASIPHIIPDYIPKARSSLSVSLHQEHSAARMQQSPPTSQTGLASGAAEQASANTVSPMLRRHSWSLSTARSQSETQLPVSQPAGAKSLAKSSVQAVPDSLNQSRSGRGPSPSAFAPHTPGAAGTPPKYPSGGLAARMSQAAFQAASQAAAKLYPGQNRGHYQSTSRMALQDLPRRFSESGEPHMPKADKRQEEAPEKSDAYSETLQCGKPSVDSTSGPRSASKPVGIPGCQGDSRRLHSSDDLRQLGHEGYKRPSSHAIVSSRKAAASAPAAEVHFGFSPKQPPKSIAGFSPFATLSRTPPQPSEKEMPAQPGTPPALQDLPSLGSASDSSPSSSFPASCSPQLPFTFTPSNQSYTSTGDPQRRDSGLAAMPAMSPPSKDINTMAVARRPSWGNRSSANFEVTPGLPNAVGYSISPILDSLSSSLFSSSTPRGSQLPHAQAMGLSPHQYHVVTDSKKSDEAGVKGSLYGPPRITFPTDPPTPGTEMELDADLLPFAIDRDSSLPSPPHPSAQNEDLSIGALSEMDLNMTGLETEADADVGAFVRLLQEAPSLHRASNGVQADSDQCRKQSNLPSSFEMSLQAGLDQLARLRLEISQMPMDSTGSKIENAKC